MLSYFLPKILKGVMHSAVLYGAISREGRDLRLRNSLDTDYFDHRVIAVI